MSARDDLAHELVNGRIAHRGSLAECEREVGEALDAYRAEVLREAAAAQWAASPWGPEGTNCSCNLDYCDACDMRRVIDLIDPDKQ